MAFENLSEKLTQTFKKLRGKGVVTEKDIKESMREIKLALLEADVNFCVGKDFQIVAFAYFYHKCTPSHSACS